MPMKGNKPGSGFWTGVLVGLLLSWIFSRLSPDPNRVARAMYNLMSRFYDPALDLVSGMHELRQALVDKLELKPGDQVLEVSVGTGANLSLIAERIGPTGKIYGIDISEGMLAQARKKLAGIPCAVELQWGNAEDLPYSSDFFDAVLNFGAMNFITNRKKAIDEMARVAKPGAKIVFGDETFAPDGIPRSLASHAVLGLILRLRPPLDLVPEPGAHLTYLRNGFIFVIDWRKSWEVSS